MKIDVAIDQNLTAGLKAAGVKVRQGADRALVDQTGQTKRNLRALVTGALTIRAGNTIRSAVRKDPDKIAGFIYSNWKRVRAAGGSEGVDILSAYANGATIVPVRARWLAIPTKEAKIRRPIRSIEAWAAAKGIKLGFVPPRPGRPYALLVEESRINAKTGKTVRRRLSLGKGLQGARSKVLFILIRRNRITKRFDLGAVRSDAQHDLVAAVNRNIAVELAA